MNILKSLEQIKSKDGSYLEKFLKDSKCNKSPCKTLSNYYSYDVTFMNIQLTIDNLPKLMEIRNDISDSITKQLNTYFPVDGLMMLFIVLFNINKILL